MELNREAKAAAASTQLPAFRERLAAEGCFLAEVRLPPSLRDAVLARDWERLDREIGRETSPDGVLWNEMRRYAEFSSIEFIISIRSSILAPDEDGIWHDDGSRVLAFSLSLTPDPETVSGGRLEVRRRGAGEADPVASVPTPPFGTMIVFATGTGGFEHRILRVTHGERIIIAGWCS